MPGRIWILCGAISAAVAVAAGAFAAHVLKTRLDEKVFETFEVAVRYQMYHAIGLIITGLLVARAPSASLTTAGVLFLIGTILFSGGLYAWIFTGVKFFVLIVPVGGTAWIFAWLALAASQILLR